MFTTNSGRFISYYGREHTFDIQRQDGNNPTISTIDQLFNVLLNVWCKETAYPSCQKDYDYDNDPTYGQCAITASLVYDLFDGTIYKLKVDGGGTHYFNKINGHYIDLTSDQFDLYDIPLEYVPNEVVPREYCGMNADTNMRADRRIHQCRKDTRQSAGGSAAGRPQKHGIFRKPGHLWTRTGFSYRNRDAYRDRKDCRDDE